MAETIKSTKLRLTLKLINYLEMLQKNHMYKKKCRYGILQRFINLYNRGIATCYLFTFVYCVIAQVIHVFAILVMYLTHSNTPHEVCHRHTEKTRMDLSCCCSKNDDRTTTNKAMLLTTTYYDY